MEKRKIGQITVKKVGKKWAACISGTPEQLFNSFKLAEKEVIKMRKKYGRKHYEYNVKKKRMCNGHK